ncbi:MAG TPA: hypothetical protein VNE62_03425 [Actinomycetota bacterium]|nr:hypothetical protein [Actinomycetota bacterium]
MRTQWVVLAQAKATIGDVEGRGRAGTVFAGPAAHPSCLRGPGE